MASRYTVGATLTASSGSFVKGFNRANAAALALRSSLNQVNGALARTHGALNSSGLGNRAVVSNVGRLNSNLGRMGANVIYASDNLNDLNKRTSRLTRLASGTALYGLSREFNRVGTNSMEASRGISSVGDSAKKSNKYTQWMERDLDRFNRTARGISMTAIGATAALAGSVRKSLQTFGSYESALAGVKKTVDGTDREFRELDLTFRQMNRTMPATYEEIAGVAEIAGQLGIEKKHIATFTETMVRMGTSTNLSAEEAATALARLSNIMGTSQGDVDRLGSTVVKMGKSLPLYVEICIAN